MPRKLTNTKEDTNVNSAGPDQGTADDFPVARIGPSSEPPDLQGTARVASLRTLTSGNPNGTRDFQSVRFDMELDKVNRWIVTQEKNSPFKYRIPLTNVQYFRLEGE